MNIWNNTENVYAVEIQAKDLHDFSIVKRALTAKQRKYLYVCTFK